MVSHNSRCGETHLQRIKKQKTKGEGKKRPRQYLRCKEWAEPDANDSGRAERASERNEQVHLMLRWQPKSTRWCRLPASFVAPFTAWFETFGFSLRNNGHRRLTARFAWSGWEPAT